MLVLCNITNFQFSEKIFRKSRFFRLAKCLPIRRVCFCATIQSFNFLKKVLKKRTKIGVLKVTPWGMFFSRAPWQLNDRPKVIRLCDDMSEATLRWDSGAGTISGETAKELIRMRIMKLYYPQNQTHYRRKKHQKSPRKATVKRSVIVIPRMTKSKKSEWSLFLNERNRICYNNLCRRCVNNCKQSFRAVVISCNYVSKRSVKNSG